MTEPDEDRDEYLRARLDPAEEVLAVGPQGLVTPRRVLFAWRLKWPPRVGEWTHDELTFDEITRWSEGRQHDERPILRLEHPAHRRLQWAPAHRFLWFRWGNRTGIVEHRTTDFRFGSARSPVYLALGRCLAASGATAGEPFHESVSGSRDERLGRSVGILYIPRGRIGRLRGRLASLDHDLHHGNIHWWIRVASWLLFALPAWFISPWLVIPAIVLVEIAWIVGLQWSSRRSGSNGMSGSSESVE